MAAVTLQRVPDALLAGVVERLRALEPSTLAVLLTGSYAKGTAGIHSDLDLTAITTTPPGTAYLTWFEPRPAGPPLHVSPEFSTLQQWRTDGEEPAGWALGFPASSTARYLWESPGVRELLGEDPSLQHPADTPELEDFVAGVAKACRAARSGDRLGMRWHARDAAELAPRLLVPLNPRRVVDDRRDALDAALTLHVRPQHYADDLTVCLGLNAAPDATVVDALRRLAGELLAFLREHRPDIDAQPELTRYLVDGTLQRHLDLS